jgi:flagellar biosynthesis protein FlhF
MNTIASLLEQIRVLNGQLPALSDTERELAQSFVSTISPLATTAAGFDFKSLKQAWKEPKWRNQVGPQLHVFIGAPGCGKSTCLAKWLAQEVLLGGKIAQVWRLDGAVANTAEALSIQAEVLGVPVARAWSGESGWESGFVDLPGTDWRDTAGIEGLVAQIAALKSASVHLVLNLAYDTAVLMQQIQAFSQLPIADIIFTHLDEEPRKAKVLEFVFKTQYPVSFFTGGQNIPGSFQPATPEGLWKDITG